MNTNKTKTLNELLQAAKKALPTATKEERLLAIKVFSELLKEMEERYGNKQWTK